MAIDMDNKESTKITQAQYEAIIKRLDIMQQTMDIKFQNWDDTTKDVSDLKVEMKTIKAIVEGARDDIADNQKKIMNKVDEHLQPIPDTISDAITDSIDGVKKKKWFQLFKKHILK